MRRYWIYTGTSGVSVLHRSDCGNCGDGKGRFPGTVTHHIAPDWYGFYATRGAAIDAAASLGNEVREDVCMNWSP